MKHAITGAVVTAVCLWGALPARAQTPRDTYTRAMAQERLVRDEANNPTLLQMRRVAAIYESLVRKPPTSGYCDNALWQAANLASLAYDRFGDAADRKTAARLLTLLKAEYPASRLVPRPPAALAEIGRPATALAAAPEPRPSAPPQPVASPRSSAPLAAAN